MSKIIATVHVTAIGAKTGWIRTAKIVHITTTTPPWMTRLIDDWMKS